MAQGQARTGPRAERRKALDAALSELRNIDHYADESGHVHADDVLTAVLRILSDGEWSEQYITDIIHEYDAIEKWYA